MIGARPLGLTPATHFDTCDRPTPVNSSALTSTATRTKARAIRACDVPVSAIRDASFSLPPLVFVTIHLRLIGRSFTTFTG
jgi:hypothetical protein